MNANIKPIREQILDHLKGRRPQSVSMIAKDLQKEPTNLHRIVKDLCDAGLLIGETGTGGAIYYERVDNDTGIDLDGSVHAEPASNGRDPTHPGREQPVTPPVRTIPVVAPIVTPTAAAPAPAGEPEPAPAPTPRRRRQRLSTTDFMLTIQRLQSDSEKLARIRAILEEDSETENA